MSLSQYSSLLHISKNEATTLDRVPLVSGEEGKAYDEDWLQDLIFNNPKCLPLQELDPGFGPLVPVCREMNTGAGPVDIVFVNQHGMLTLVECKLWRNPEARREVVGQILDYAKELGSWNYDDLQREVSRVLGSPNNSLYELVSAHYPETEEAVFVDNVARNLKAGKFMLIVLGDGIRQGVEAISDFLSAHAGLHFSFGLVEAAVYQFGEDDFIVQPRVLAKTLTVTRYTVSLPDSEDMQILDREEAVQKEELSDTQLDNKKFWENFLSHLKLDDVSQPIPKPNTARNIWFVIPETSGEIWITAYRSFSKNEIGVFLHCTRNRDLARQIYESLKENKDEIDQELGQEHEWVKDDQRVVLKKNLKQPLENVPAEEQISWLASKVNLFVNVFRHRVERIVDELNDA